MNQNIFLSKTNIAPYQIITELQPNVVSLALDSNEIEDIKESTIGIMYLIVKDHNFFSNVEIRVENERNPGYSLLISKVDQVGSPILWDKLLTFENLGSYDSNEDSTIMIKYKWQIINNLYLLKSSSTTCSINIYMF